MSNKARNLLRLKPCDNFPECFGAEQLFVSFGPHLVVLRKLEVQTWKQLESALLDTFRRRYSMQLVEHLACLIHR